MFLTFRLTTNFTALVVKGLNLCISKKPQEYYLIFSYIFIPCWQSHVYSNEYIY